MRKSLGIIGTGAVGSALGILLHRQGYALAGVYDIDRSRSRNLIETTGCQLMAAPEEVAQVADILFITTKDAQIQGVVEDLAEKGAFFPGQIVIHTSGSQSAHIMAAASAGGAFLLSLHPLQSFANDAMAIENIPGSVFSIEGDKQVYDVAVSLVELLEGEYFFINEQAKPVYHAGACVVSNYLVGLMHLGVQLLVSADVPEELAQKALLPLLRGTVHNLENMPPAEALTGPIARGDAETIEKQLAGMEQLIPEMTQLYSELGLYTTRLAAKKGTDPVQLQRIRQVFADEVGMMRRR
jgi:predicted short-subunit dehydrogenase-like oxidoreductase (DUF2520 family)